MLLFLTLLAAVTKTSFGGELSCHTQKINNMNEPELFIRASVSFRSVIYKTLVGKTCAYNRMSFQQSINLQIFFRQENDDANDSTCKLQSDFQQEKAQMHHKILAPQNDLQAKTMIENYRKREIKYCKMKQEIEFFKNHN